MMLCARLSQIVRNVNRLTHVGPRSWSPASFSPSGSQAPSFHSSSKHLAVGDRSRLWSSGEDLSLLSRRGGAVFQNPGIALRSCRQSCATRTVSKHASSSDLEEINKEFDEFFGTSSTGSSPSPPNFIDPPPPLPARPHLHRPLDFDLPSTDPSSPSPSQLSHVDSQGKVKMVDTSGKAESSRVAWATARVLLGEEAFGLVAQNKIGKGDVLTVARIAGINGAKMTSNIIPLCHNVPLSGVTVDLSLDAASHSVEIITSATARGPTGVEMEALAAASVAALTVYDMCKAVTKGIEIVHVRLLAKSGGKSGTWVREGEQGPRLLGAEETSDSHNESLMLQDESHWTPTLPHAR